MTGTTVRCETSQPGSICISKPEVSQGADIHRLVARCEPLDLNSRYAYLLLCEHFADTCVLARAEEVVGFVSAYKPPARDDTIFVWQVAVDARMRGKGVAAALLEELIQRPQVMGCRYLETTISPSNTASRALFQGLARNLRAPINETVLFPDSVFGEEAHECEMLIRIGPFPGK
ncbi:MAG TPA: diaminobutyrate acetyltransferase [Woeseiaceae bacterium]|nr:diaminobutyrate acetyltransferase [Woeseiaceae bacterium]